MRHHYTLALSLLLASGLALAVDKVVELRPQSATPSLIAPADAASPLRSHADPDGAFRADIEATLNVSPALSVAGNLSHPQGAITFTSFPKPELRPVGTAVRSDEALPASAMRKVPARTARIVEGYYVGKDYVHGGDEVNCIMQVVADANDSTMIHIHNFYGLEETVDAVVHVNTGALTILPQRIWQSESYGDVYMFPISYVGDRVQYFPTQPVPGTIDADGVIRLGQWAAIVGQGAAAGIFGTGAMPIAKVSHAVNFGNVTLSRVVPEKGFGAGGIWGGYGPVDISECYNYGTVSAPDWAAGINPAMHSNGNGGSSIVRCYNAGKVVATSDTASHVANIALISHYVDTRNPIDPTLMHIDSVYFDNEVCTAFAGDTIGKGLTRVELLTAPLGDAFTYRPACLPTLSFMDSVAVASFHAAHILLNESDSFDNVNKSFRVGMMPRAQQTGSDNVSINAEGVASVLGTGDGWVKVTTDEPGSDLEKSFELKFASSGVEGTLIDGREVKSREFYTSDGMRVAEPVNGRIYIVRTLFTDGTTSTEKAIYVK